MALRSVAAHIQPPLLTPEQGSAFFDREVRRLADMTGEEFLRLWDENRIQIHDDSPESRDLTYLIMLIPFGRQDR